MSFKKKIYLTFSNLFVVISILLCLFIVPDKHSNIDNYWVNFYTLLSVLNIIVFFKTVIKFYKTWIRFDVLFLFGYLIVHFQTVYLYSNFGIQTTKMSFWTNKYVVNYGLWLSTISILIWIFGFYLFLFSKRNRKEMKSKPYFIKTPKYFNKLIIFVFIVFGILVGRSFWSGNYEGSSNWGTGATYIYLVLRALISLAVIYFFVNNRGKLNSIRKIRKELFRNKSLLFVTSFYILIFLFQGDRGPVMQLMLLIIGCYTIFQANISFIKIFAFIAMGTLLFTIIGLGRSSTSDSSNKGMFTEGYDKLQSQENIIPTEELAWSGSILYKAIDLNPNGSAYLKGITIFNNLIGIIPMSSIIYTPPNVYKSSSSYFTYIYKGPNAKFGVGTEIISDLYINFGLWPTLVIFFLFGVLISYFTYQSHMLKNYRPILIYLILLTLSIYINRAIFFTPLKYILYLVVFDYLFGKKIYKSVYFEKNSISSSWA